MSRYGWSRSPYSSQPGGVPTVSEDDYAYITSQDLDDHGLGSSASARPQHSPAAADADVLLVKSRGVNYPLHFPRHSIADGKLQVRDIAERARLIMSLSDRELRSLRFIYRGRQLKEPLAPVRDYGVKDNSTLMAVLPDRNDRADHSDEETVVVNESKSQRKNKRRKAAKKRNAGDADQPSSPNDSASNGGAKSPSPVPGAAGQRRIDEIAADFNAKWLPVCSEYIAKPPADPRKRVDEHTRLSETVLQHVLLKLDEVDTEGNQDVRQSRKDLIHTVQEVLRKMDTARGPVDN